MWEMPAQVKYVDPAAEAEEAMPAAAAAAPLDYLQLSHRLMQGAFRDYGGAVDPRCRPRLRRCRWQALRAFCSHSACGLVELTVLHAGKDLDY